MDDRTVPERRELTAAQRKAAALIGDGLPHARVADEIGVTPRTLRNWATLPEYAEAVEEARRESIRALLEGHGKLAKFLEGMSVAALTDFLTKHATKGFRSALEATRTLEAAVRMARTARGLSDPSATQIHVNAQANASVQAFAGVVLGSVREFLEGDLALPIASIYPRVEWIVEQADRPDVRTVLLQLGKGSGKGLVIAASLARCLQRALVHRDPASAFRLMPGEKVGIVNLSVTGEQAQMAVFDTLARFIRNSPWFQPHRPKEMADRIEFLGRNLVVLSGSSSSKGVEGISWLAAGADEVDRLPETEARGVTRASDLVEPVEATMLTRFAADRKILIASWPEHRGSYVCERIDAARKAGVQEDLTAALRAVPIVRGDATADAERRDRISRPPFVEYQAEAFMSADGTLCVVGPTWEFKPDADLAAFEAEEKKNEYGFSRMFGARPKSAGANPLIRDMAEFRRRANRNRRHPVDDCGRFHDWFKGDPATWYFGHLDLGIRHDAAGIAVGHYDEGKVVYDLLWEIRPQDEGELRIGRLLDIFADLKRRGFSFFVVTRDGYQGIAVGQDLENRGISTEEFSVDRKRAAYDTWLQAYYAGQLDYYEYEPFFRNVESLIDLGRKVDHQPGAGSAKDVADAAAAVCYRVLDSVA